MDLRSKYFLKKEDVLKCLNGDTYHIIGDPIGVGGGSVLYPAVKNGTRVHFAIKECFPNSDSQELIFIRKNGVVQPKNPEDKEAQLYLENMRKQFRQEGYSSQEISNTNGRAVGVWQNLLVDRIIVDGEEYSARDGIFMTLERLNEKGCFLSEILEECLLPKEYGHLLRTGGLPHVYTTARIMEQLLKALDKVHQSGYLHGDVQDGNLFFNDSRLDEGDIGFGCLIDFGCARKLNKDGKTEEISDRIIYSTLGFIAPEIIKKNDGHLRLTPAADIYSAGRLMLYLLKGKKFIRNGRDRVYTDDTLIEMLGTDCEKIGCGETAQKLINFILRNSLQSEPDDRYQDAGEMLEDVQRLVEELRPSKNRLSLGLSTLSEGEFLGREEELEQLDMSLRQHRNPIVIWGFGGMGKTELAIEFGRRKMSTCQVYFVRFDTSFYETVVGPIADAFSGYSRYDARGREKTEEQVYEEVMKLLGELSPDDVLIIDNVDSETEEMSELLDDRYRALCGLSLHLIITSRTRCEGYGIEVGELERKELHELMQRFVKISENEMDALIDTVEGHTLTVELIARTLKYSYPPISVEEMLTKLKEGDLDSENLAKVSVRKDRDERKWKIEEHLRCLFRITELPSMELSYLKNAILIDTKKGLYYNWFASACPDFDQNVMIHLLERGWIKLNREENLLTVHPLIQQLVENEINRIPEDSNIFLSRLWKVFEKNRYKYSKKEVDQIAEVFYNALLQKVDYPQWNEWIDGLCYWLDEVIDELKLSIRCKEEILATLRDKNIDEERRLCIMLDNIDILEKIYRGKSNIENEVLAATYNSVANIYIERKDYVNAFCYLKKAAKCKSSTRAINNLGWMYLYGYGCEQDVSQAINIFLYAANSEIKPDKLANRHLGKLYLGVHPAISNEEIIDFEKALYYLERAKQLGADDVDKLIEKAKNMLNDK